MTIRKYNLSLDVKDQSYAPQIITRQGDATGTTQLNVSITDNGAPVAFAGTPQFRALTSISKLVVVDSSNFSNVDANQGAFTYNIPSQVLSEPGRLYVAYFAIADSSGVESTVGLTIFVQQAADLNPAHYGDYLSAVDGVVESTKDSITDLKQKIAEAQAAWAGGSFVSITTDQTITGAKTFTAPINGALATRAATFTDFATVAANMNTYAGNWYVVDTPIANAPVDNMKYYVVEVIPGNGTTNGTIRVNKYGENSYFAIPNSGVLGTWYRVATDADVAIINGSINDNKITATDWTSTGVVMTNGFTSNQDNPLQYLIEKVGATKIIRLYVAGLISNNESVKIVQGSAKTIAQFPDVVKNLLNGVGGHAKLVSNRETNSNWGNPVEFGLNGQGELQAQSRGTDLGNGELVFVDLILLVTTNAVN